MSGISRVVSSSPTDDEMYLARPKACRNRNIGSFDLPEKLHRSDIVANGFKNVDGDEDASVHLQFWLPSNVGRRNLLKTVDKPFCLGQHNEGLCNYISESERCCFFMDEDCKEEDLIIIPVVRVFRRRISEWTSDVKKYQSKKQLLHDYAIRLNHHGYWVLPVFDSITMLCVGVSELITSSKDLDCAYEFQEVHQALKEANLTSPQAFECPASYVNYKKHELDEIFKLLKDVRNTHRLPLAQTWTCNSFNTRCIGKVCMPTTGLPFYAKDLRFWHFREACRKRKMDSIPIEEASSKLGVNGSKPNRVCSEASIASWPTPHHNKKYAHFGISDVVLLLVRIKRWICLSNHHGFSAKWWICRKHNSKFVCKSNPSVHKHETICGSYAHSGVYQSSPKKNKVYNALDKRMVTVKATYKDDMIKFIFPLSSGLSELKKQVAKRFKLEATRLCLNYKDEDDDLILISCDADLRNLMPFSASPVGKNTIKLIVQMVKD
ncbi:hypothetical protein E3N88_30857 [Mikania micrantha]|uniref:PB1 domain-containing protein n=1 Tax=Mikania micrantha TaxID=192012 RepID=A0A5N6MN98_9ASTR|nr:hypothetical protein E3N88_30857 [Mikania micrantha]